MLDVHPPHFPTHTWRDFFIHVGTIVIGLLIAVGLEQAVEAIHRGHQRADTRESMERESRQIIKDAGSTTAATDYHLHWLLDRIESVRNAVWAGKPIPPAAIYNPPVFDYPDDPLWRSAKSSGLAELLTSDERNAYSEIELLAAKVDTYYDRSRSARRSRTEFEGEFPANGDNTPDFTRATPEDKRTYLKLLMAEAGETAVFRLWNGDLIGAEQTIMARDLQLEDIFKAERRMQNSPETLRALHEESNQSEPKPAIRP
jgi:hypothetical protein